MSLFIFLVGCVALPKELKLMSLPMVCLALLKDVRFVVMSVSFCPPCDLLRVL